MKLLFVCLGNICRSPMAEGALRARLEASVLAGHVQVDSAGTSDWHIGRAPDPRAIACARRHGVDIAGLRARQLQVQDFVRFDRVFCADQANLQDASKLAGAAGGERLALWLPWAGIDGDGSIPDPYYGGPEDFEQTWTLVDAAAQATVRRMVQAAESGIIGP
ncbi:low molecular weight protein-tyrosine-phosphatase [Stenotrophomonas sp. YIM B06876]|uniref:low molecular weight protein-tyrosine-phosphatase n=1 Tax=Stenotrophomonas sp. YIM B06876 TaxID=3060211 RepID=UPI0027387BB9|nr:low molecular weight protein-tyrosine-phosphatase [Stenotrophomonas sp. YIM B06876]